MLGWTVVPEDPGSNHSRGRKNVTVTKEYYLILISILWNPRSKMLSRSLNICQNIYSLCTDRREKRYPNNTTVHVIIIFKIMNNTMI